MACPERRCLVDRCAELGAGVGALLMLGYVLVVAAGFLWLALQVVGIVAPGPVPFLP